MTPHPAPHNAPVRNAFIAAGFTLLTIGSLDAAEIVKANNNTNSLDQTNSWVGGVLPGINDTIVFDSTLDVSRSAALASATNPTGLSVYGITVKNPTVGTTQTISYYSGSTLTLGAGGIDMSTDSTAATLVIDNVINFAANQTWSLGTGDSLTLGTNGKTSTGSGNLTISGPGTFNLASAGGSLTYSFGSGTLTLGGGLTLANSSSSASTSARVITNATKLNGDITILNPSAVSSSNTAVSFTGGLDVGEDTRTITLSRPNNTVAAGSTNSAVLQVTTANGITGSGTLVVNNASTDTSLTAMLLIAAGGSVDVGTLRIGNNVYLANTSTTGDIGSNTNLIVDAGGIYTVMLGGTNNITRNIKSLAGAGTVTNLSTSTSGSTLAINGGTSTTTTIFSGIITNGSTAPIAIIKSGTTTQVFSGANTYTGQTQVTGGSLFINGTHIDSAAGTGYGSTTNGHYLVASGATLGGSGRIAGTTSSNGSNMILVQSGGTLAPGGDTSVGTFVLDGGSIGGSGSRVLNMASGAKFDFTLSGSGGVSDQLALWNYVSGDLLLNSNAIFLSLTGTEVAGTYTVSLITFYSDSGSSVAASGISSGIGSITLGAGISSASITYNTNSIDITYTVTSTIPEPSSAAVLLGIAALACTAAPRRRSPR